MVCVCVRAHVCVCGLGQRIWAFLCSVKQPQDQMREGYSIAQHYLHGC